MSIIKKFIELSQTIYDVVEDYKENGIDYIGFDYPKKKTDEKVWNFYNNHYGKVWARMNYVDVKELHVRIYENYSDDPIIDLGIPIIQINSKEDIIKAVKEELDLILTHYEMMMDEFEENE